MDIIIKTGFQKIHHDILFHPETIPKGKKLVMAGHVCQVQEHRRNGVSYLIKASVIRQTSVTLQPYNVELYIDTSRLITTVKCNCVYNKSYKCKHIAALICYVNYSESLSKTDHEQQWGKPSMRQMVQNKYCKEKLFEEMFPSKEETVARPHRVDISELKQPSSLQVILLNMNKDEDDRAARNIITNLLNEVDAVLAKGSCIFCLNIFYSFRKNYIVNSLFKEFANKEDEEFYLKYVVIRRQEIIQLCCNTISQSTSTEWFAARYFRLSASENIHKIKIRKKKSEEDLIASFLFPKPLNNSATQYGKSYEAIARQEYENLFDVEVKTVGVLVSEDQPWLCGSLDGAVIKKDILVKILEIKCPVSCLNKPIVDIQSKKSNVKYLEFQDNCVVLKKTHQYYTQCQTLMYLSGVNTCDLFVYTPYPNGSICVMVQRNELFLKEVICKCGSFYFKSFLQHLRKKVLSDKQQNPRTFSGYDITNSI